MRDLPRMNPQADRPDSATRRRVRVFVIGGILALLVVGFWPLRGYEIDDEQAFLESLGAPSVHTPFFLGVDTPVTLVLVSGDWFPSEEEFRHMSGLAVSEFGADTELHAASTSRARAYIGTVGPPPSCVLVFQYRNIIGSLSVDPDHSDIQKGQTAEAVAFERLDAILDGLEREAPGVRAVSMPPAVQLWRHKLAPFLRKHFP